MKRDADKNRGIGSLSPERLRKKHTNTCTHTHTHSHTLAYQHTHAHHTHTHTHTLVHTHTHTHPHPHTHSLTHTHPHTHRGLEGVQQSCDSPVDMKKGIRNFPLSTRLRSDCNVLPSKGRAPHTNTYSTTPKL